MLTKATKRNQMSDNLRNIAITFWNEIEYVQNETQAHINMLNMFGIGSQHVSVPFALSESQRLYNDILSIVDSHNVAHRAHQCALYLIDQWSNTSAVLGMQLDEATQLKYDTINAKNRLYDLIQNVYKASDAITGAKAIQKTNEKSYGRLLHQHHKILQLNGQINDIYRTNVFPETDTVFNMIDDNHQKLRQDLSSINQLKTIVRDTNEHSAQQLNVIREDWLPLAQNRSSHLVNKAREYVGLFQNTKNSAEVAMLARLDFFSAFFSSGSFFMNFSLSEFCKYFSRKCVNFMINFFRSTAYKNITESVSSARDLAALARLTALRSENELYPKESESIIEKSSKSLQKSQKIHQHALQEIEKLEGNKFSFAKN